MRLIRHLCVCWASVLTWNMGVYGIAYDEMGWDGKALFGDLRLSGCVWICMGLWCLYLNVAECLYL